MTKAQERKHLRDDIKDADIHSALFVKQKKNRRWLWLAATPILVFAVTILFVRSRAPEPVDLSKVINAKPTANGYSKDDIAYLDSLGFKGSSTIKENLALYDYKTKEEVFDRYGLKYISHLEFDEAILKRYNLEFAPLDRYIRSVPKKNLDEMRNRLAAIEKADAIHKDASSALPEWSDDKIFLGVRMASQVGDVITVTWSDGTVEQYRSPLRSNNSDVLICAPRSYFDTEGMEFSDKMKTWLVPEPKDPIVVKKYKNGYIILTAWEE
jgi:hypothetical protein